MKIVFLVERFPPYIGGIPKRAYKIAKGLTERGHEVTVYTEFHPEAPRAERINGIKVRRYDARARTLARFLHRARVKVPHPPLMPQLFTLLGNKEIQDADIVQSFRFMSFVSLVAASLKLFRKKVFALAPLCPPSYRGIPGLSSNPPFILYRLTLGMAVLHYADLNITETNFEKSNLISVFGVRPNKIQVIPDGIDHKKYKQLPDAGAFRKEHKIGQNARVILFVGLPSLREGLPHLLLAMHSVFQKIKDATLLLVGPRPGMEFMLNKFGSSVVRNRTVVTGYVREESLLSAYSTSDVFVMPSLVEAFGISILEAAASGLPIVCTRTGVAPDIVVNGKNGLLVRYGNVDQISNAIVRVLNDDRFKMEAEKRRKQVLKTYDHRKEIDQYEKTYLRLTQ
jgi:glycosyltransferase involved in cell wall biosynthesis